MAEGGNSNNAFENLTQSGLVRINSKDDKNVSFSIDVWGGNTSFVVFTGAGGKPWKLGIPSKVRALLVALLRKMKADPRPRREPLMINEFVEADGKRKFQQKGSIGFGIDENLVPFIDVAANDLQGRHMFPIKPDGRFDFSNTEMNEKDMLSAHLGWLIDVLENTVPTAERLSSFKRQGGGAGRGNFGGGGGGNRGGYGGGGNNNNYGGNGGGGGGQQSGTFGGGGGGGSDVADDLHV